MVLNLVGDSAGYARKIAVLGDMLELGEGEEQFHASAGDQVATNEFTILIAVGALSKFMAETAEKKGVEVYMVETSEEAAEKAVDLVKEGDLVLVKGSRGMQMEKVVNRLAAK
jgi:UDP-N-acetylmuramoyl-tripeptide--D-alanyl-D-alanine ligase